MLIKVLILICIKWVSVDPSAIFLATIFTQKMPYSSGSSYSSILMLGNMWHHHFTWSGPNSQEIVNLFQFSSGPRGPTIGAKFPISCEFSLFQVKWLCNMFSKMKMEEYMESRLSGIFRVKVVAKNILLGFLETQHQVLFAMWCLFLKKHANLSQPNCYV